MTADWPADDERRTAELSAPSLSDTTSGAVPRIWTVFVAYLAAFVGSVLVQIVAVVVLVAWHLTHGRSINQLTSDLQAMVSTPAAVIALGSLSQLAIGLAAFIPANFRPSRREAAGTGLARLAHVGLLDYRVWGRGSASAWYCASHSACPGHQTRHKRSTPLRADDLGVGCSFCAIHRAGARLRGRNLFSRLHAAPAFATLVPGGRHPGHYGSVRDHAHHASRHGERVRDRSLAGCAGLANRLGLAVRCQPCLYQWVMEHLANRKNIGRLPAHSTHHSDGDAMCSCARLFSRVSLAPCAAAIANRFAGSRSAIAYCNGTYPPPGR